MREITVRELGRVVTGHTPPTKKREYYGNVYPFVKPTDMNIGEKYTYVTDEGYSELGYEKYKTSLIPKGATCVVCIGTLGDKMTMAHCDLFTNQSVNSIIPSEYFDNHYVFYLLKYNLGKVKALNKGTASGREFVSKTTFLDMPIVVHEDISIQRRIGEVLSTYDDLIENNQKQIKLLEEAAQRLYKEWFVDLRFPGYETTPINDGIPRGWGVVSVTDVLEIRYGKDHKTLNEGKIATYGSGGIMRYVDELLYSGESVLIPRKGSLNNIFYVNDEFWTIDTMFYSIPKKRNIAKYMFLYLRGLDMYSYNIGAAVPSMTVKILDGIHLLLPSEELLLKFEELISPLFQQRSILNCYCNHIKQARDCLLPKLMSGELEV